MQKRGNVDIECISIFQKTVLIEMSNTLDISTEKYICSQNSLKVKNITENLPPSYLEYQGKVEDKNEKIKI